MEQLLLVASCDSPAGIGVSLRTDGRTHGRTNTGWTDRRAIQNSDSIESNSLREYILGSGAPGTTGVTHKTYFISDIL